MSDMAEQLEAHVDYSAHQFCGIPFEQCHSVDFRKRQWREAFAVCHPHAANGKDHRALHKGFKRLCKQLYEQAGDAGSLGNLGSLATNLSITCHTDLPLPHQQLCGRILGWWTRWQIRQKGIAAVARHQLKNDMDPISLDDIDCIPSPFLFTLGHFAFDIRHLRLLASEGMRHPYTNQGFTPAECHCIQERWSRLQDRLRYAAPSSGGASASAAPTILQRVVSAFQKIDALDYVTDVQWFMDMDVSLIRHWYRSAEDIWNYRAELTPETKATIVPPASGHQPLFSDLARVKTVSNLDQLRGFALDAIERMVSSGEKKEDRSLGAMYVLSAMTECSDAARATYPWLYQPAH